MTVEKITPQQYGEFDQFTVPWIVRGDFAYGTLETNGTKVRYSGRLLIWRPSPAEVYQYDFVGAQRPDGEFISLHAVAWSKILGGASRGSAQRGESSIFHGGCETSL
jgi:hypothetical protein